MNIEVLYTKNTKIFSLNVIYVHMFKSSVTFTFYFVNIEALFLKYNNKKRAKNILHNADNRNTTRHQGRNDFNKTKT